MVKEYVFINVFRALAAFWVLIAHCMIWGGWYGLPLPQPKIAVDLFMIISGFLMAANAFARREKEPLSVKSNWYRFWLRRFFRIAPAYYISLLLVVIGSTYFLGGAKELQLLNPKQWTSSIYDPARIEYTLENVILHLSFLFGLHPAWSFSTMLPDWSLSLEMQFYFVFPFLLLLMSKYGFARSGIVIGLSSFAIGMFIASSVKFYEPSLLFFKLQYFIAGMLIYRILSSPESAGYTIIRILCALVLVSLEIPLYGKHGLVLPMLVLSMLLLGRWERIDYTPVWLKSLLESRLVRFASDTSYGVYLFHGFFISAAGWILSGNTGLLALEPKLRVMFMFVFVSLSAYLVGSIIFRYIERPGIAMGKTLIRKL